MRYEVEVGGRIRRVEVSRPARPGEAFLVTLDGRSWRVDAARVDPHTLSLIIANGEPADRGAGGGVSHEVVLASDRASGRLEVRVDGTPVTAALNGRRWGSRDAGADAASGPDRVVAPMPGKVARVLVETGETVRARQPLVVIEAMKMENELRASRDGTVAEVRVSAGASVDAGALLVVVQ